MTLEWDAAEYEVVANPHVGWGTGLLEVALERRPLVGDEAAMDAGCGTGRVTELLLERLPGGTVLAVDASGAMVEAARRRFAGDERVRVERWDLLKLEVEEPVDLILSTATFHWIKNHEKLFNVLASALKPGGRLVAQCGGQGNIAQVTRAIEEVMGEERFREHFAGWRDNKEYADPATTKARLEAAGFEEIETWLHEEPTEFGSTEELTRYLKAVVLGRHLERLPEVDHQSFADAVATRVAAVQDPPVMDYVRLNILATRRRES
ncbi:MAG: Biotin synthesis protein BioC [uncultured Rubrobacteraceae bacterium]|uniref:Biotin synthesis protein BioC n=1 Tax=uncultured Rubrobacteraceae bacterium TaxID=349277 RepID=A0A6J4RAM9_9ACTN|nr:MAG: Biotin synthesis protein BioC [uncultured Rubrobacteraceae bacterium]